MARYDLFVSVVAPCRNAGPSFAAALEGVIRVLAEHYSYYEVVIVDDASTDDTPRKTTDLLKVHEGLRLIRLTKPHGVDIAVSAGLDSAIGDFVVVMDPLSDPAAMIPDLVSQCLKTGGVHYGESTGRRSGILHRLGAAAFAWYCRRHLRVDPQRRSGIFRVFSRAAVNNFTQMKDRSRMLRLMTANLGVEVHSFPYTPTSPSRLLEAGGLFDDLNMAFDILVATSRHPLRWFSRLGVMAAFLNVLYALYVVGIYLFKSRVAEGWVTLSMQQAVMFFFLFLVAAVLCEYVGKILVESQNRPLYTILEERNSSVLVDAAKRRNIVAESPKENPS
jgi:hypothetical protein